MNRRMILFGTPLLAFLAATPAVPQSAAIEFSDLKIMWQVFRDARTVEEAQHVLAPRFGKLPWHFVGTLKLGALGDPSPYKPVATSVYTIRRDVEADLMGFGPAVILEMEIREPALAHGMQRFRVIMGQGLPIPMGRRLQ